MSFVELDDVSFAYPNGVLAVDGVTLDLDLGESVAVIGQNGAGKTTTVKMINGLLRPTRGSVVVGGVRTTERTAAATARDVGYVFQNPDDQIFNTTVRAEIGYALRRLKVDADEIDARVRAAVELCGLQDELHTNPYDLPLSIRKFITIASVVTIDPQVIILDEPTAGQDLVGLDRIAHILEYLSATGKLVVTITHDMEFVAEHFDRVIVMANRKVVADGDRSRIFEDVEVMGAARLRQPVLARCYAELGLEQADIHVDDLVRRLRR